jgi:hypothetical protein
MSLLEFEIEMLEKVLSEDSLLVTSSGLALYRHLMELMKHFIESKSKHFFDPLHCAFTHTERF